MPNEEIESREEALREREVKLKEAEDRLSERIDRLEEDWNRAIEEQQQSIETAMVALDREEEKIEENAIAGEANVAVALETKALQTDDKEERRELLELAGKWRAQDQNRRGVAKFNEEHLAKIKADRYAFIVRLVASLLASVVLLSLTVYIVTTDEPPSSGVAFAVLGLAAIFGSKAFVAVVDSIKKWGSK